MPVNWNLLNPNIAAQAQMVDPFAAIQKGMAQADQREAQGLERELQGMKIQQARSEIATAQSTSQAMQLMAQAEARAKGGDSAGAEQLFNQAMQLSPTAWQEWQKNRMEIADKTTSMEGRVLENKGNQLKIDARVADLAIAAADALDQAFKTNPTLDQAGVEQIARQYMGDYYDARQLPRMMTAEGRAAARTAAQKIKQSDPDQAGIIGDAETRAETARAHRADEAVARERLRVDQDRERRLSQGGGSGGINISMDENGQPVIQIGGGGPAGTAVQNSQGQLLLSLNAVQPSWDRYGKVLFDPQLSPTSAGATGAVLSAIRGVSNQIPFTRSAAEWADKQLPVRLNDRQAQQMRYMAETLEMQLAPVFAAASKGNPSNKDIQRVREAIGVLGTTDDLNRARFAYGYINDYMATLRTQAESVTGSGRLPAPRGMQPVVPPQAPVQPAPAGGPRRMTREEIRAALRGGAR